VDVKIPAGPSGLEPAQTSFFQALNINTKIVKGMIELAAEVHLIHAGDKVSLSAQALLAKMNIKPFEYGMTIDKVYQDGSVFDAKVLEITDDVLIGKFMNGVSHVAAFGREIGIPTEAGLPHMIVSCFKNIVSLTVDIDFSAGEKADEVKTLLKDPEAMAKMQAAAAASSAGAAGGDAAADAAPAAAEVEEEEEEMEFDLF
jgi:large subunit ribosomal protein LP0